MSGLKILHIIDHIYPVLGYQETFLAKAHSRNNETMVITSDRYADEIYDANSHLLGKRIVGSGYFYEEGLKILRLPVRLNITVLNSPWLVGLEKSVITFKPDVIIAHGVVNSTSIRLALLKRKLSDSKLIFDDHMTFNASREGWTKLFYRSFRITCTPIFVKYATAFVAVTPETKKFMHERYGIPKDLIKIIPLGIDKEHFCYDSRIRKLVRKDLGLEEDDVAFIYAGKIVPWKGVHLFIDAGLRVCKDHDKVKFVIVGGSDPAYLADLRKRIIGKMKDHFIFMDAVPNNELYKLYNATDVGVWPLQCSVAMLEASGCGLSVIISDKCGATERVQSGNGLLYRESDIDDLTRKIVLLLDKKTRNNLSGRALTFTKTLSWTELASLFLEIS